MNRTFIDNGYVVVPDVLSLGVVQDIRSRCIEDADKAGRRLLPTGEAGRSDD